MHNQYSQKLLITQLNTTFPIFIRVGTLFSCNVGSFLKTLLWSFQLKIQTQS